MFMLIFNGISALGAQENQNTQNRIHDIYVIYENFKTVDRALFYRISEKAPTPEVYRISLYVPFTRQIILSLWILKWFTVDEQVNVYVFDFEIQARSYYN